MINNLELINFRNFKKAIVEFSPGVNVIWGLNGQGKTNLLEAVHVLSFTKSMRTNSERDLILFGEDYAIVVGNGLEIRFSYGSRKQLIKDGVKYLNSKEWLGSLPVVFFGPQELGLVKNEPGVRRRFMDMALCQLKPGYTRALSDYNRAKDQKARILKCCREKPSLLEALPDFNEKMIQSGEILIRERTRFLERVSEIASKYHAGISGKKEELEVSYITKKDLRASIEELSGRELAAGVPLTGPHRDDILTKLNGADARAYASQGQAKTAALAFKLAERDILEETLGTAPIMLLDDVLSELDVLRRQYILRYQEKGQILITDCDQTRLRELKAGKTIHITDGKICI